MFLLLGIFLKTNAQGKYSVDVKSRKERRVPLSYRMDQTKEQLIIAHEWRKNNRVEKRLSKRTKQRIYQIQTSEVKKRMKRSERKAKNYNRGKASLRVKFKRLVTNG